MVGFRPGDLIYRSKPYVYTLEENEKGHRCDYCFIKLPDLKRCSQCKNMYFCDQNCQKHGIHEPFEEVWGHKVDFDRLMSHSDKVSDESVATAYGILQQYFQENDFLSGSKLREIIGKVRTNAFSILDPKSMRSIGGGVYLGGSMFDHSCEPNAEVVFDGPEMIIRAVEEIPEKDITQVYISYIEQIQLTENRLKFLDEQYHFTCECCRCTSSYYDDLMSKTAVDKAECESLLEDFKEKVATIKQMLIDSVPPSTIHDACLVELQKQDNILTDTHLYRIKILEYAFDACIENSQWTDAATIGEQLIKPYKLLYGRHHPQLGLHSFKLGKIQNLLNHLESAKQYLLQAEDIIKITHGEDHPLYRELVYENLGFL